MRIAIIGKGTWAHAIGSLLEYNHQSYTYYGRDEQVEADIIFLAVPAESIASALTYVTYSPETIIINTSKGLQKESGKLPYQIVTDAFGKDINYFSLLGPGFANQLISQQLTIANIGYSDKKNLYAIKELLTTPYFKVIDSPHIQALEIVAAFKNVYAIACGIAAGLGYKENTQTALILLAIQELYTVLDTLNISYDTSIMTEMLGDMVLTCSSTESRNYKFGTLLIAKTAEQALKELETVEGYHTSQYLNEFQKQHGVHLLLASTVDQIIQTNNPEHVKQLFNESLQKV